MRLLIGVVVHSAGIQDRDGIKRVLAETKGRVPRRKRIWADGSYEAAVDWVWSFGRRVPDLLRKPRGLKKFTALPRRWVVDRGEPPTSPRPGDYPGQKAPV
jgi:putative transposase